MRLATTIAIDAKGEELLLSGPGTPTGAQKKQFKRLIAANLKLGSEQFEQVHLFIGGERCRTIRRKIEAKPQTPGVVSTLDALAEALGLPVKDLVAARDAKPAVFPRKAKEGYVVADYEAWAAAL